MPTLTASQTLAVEQQLRELKLVLTEAQRQFTNADAELNAAKIEFEQADEVVNRPLRKREQAWNRFTVASKTHTRLRDTLFQSRQQVERLEKELHK